MAPWFDTEDDFDHDLLNKLSGISFPNYSESKALNFAVDYIGQKGWLWTIKQCEGSYSVSINYSGEESYAEDQVLNKAVFLCLCDVLTYHNNQ